MRLSLPVLCSFGSRDEPTFKPLKRLPFGPSSVIDRPDYVAPEPPPPNDFYPRKPLHWKIRGTPANKTRMFVCVSVAVYGFVSLAIFAYFVEGPGDRWYKRVSGREVPSMDEAYTKDVEARMRNMHLHRFTLDPETSDRTMKQVLEGWKYSGRFGDGTRTNMENRGDPTTDDL